MTSDDVLTFADEDDSAASPPQASSPWLILVVDDEPDVHQLTNLQLTGFLFQGRPAQVVNAYSFTSAKEALAKNPGLAVVLLDVVMETDDAGLRLVRHIRDELGMAAVRIILRTGQPGAAPEAYVVANYDINDYRAKTDLTHENLWSCLTAALRNYDGIIALESAREAEKLSFQKAERQWLEAQAPGRRRSADQDSKVYALEIEISNGLSGLGESIAVIRDQAGRLARTIDDRPELRAIAESTRRLEKVSGALNSWVAELLALARGH